MDPKTVAIDPDCYRAGSERNGICVGDPAHGGCLSGGYREADGADVHVPLQDPSRHVAVGLDDLRGQPGPDPNESKRSFSRMSLVVDDVHPGGNPRHEQRRSDPEREQQRVEVAREQELDGGQENRVAGVA